MMPHLPYVRRTVVPGPPAAALPAPEGARTEVDLQSQLEALFDTVWKAEADWRFNDRLDMSLKQPPPD